MANFILKSGSCKPQDAGSLVAAKELQKQLNRAAQAKGYSKIAVDGDVGPKTVALANKVTTQSYPDCMTLTRVIGFVTGIAKSIADGASVPAQVAAPQPKETKLITSNSDGSINYPAPSMMDRVMDNKLLLGVGALAGFLFWKSRKKR